MTPPVAQYNYDLEQAEGSLNSEHAKIASSHEQIDFAAGGAVEKNTLKRLFRRIRDVASTLHRRPAQLGWEEVKKKRRCSRKIPRE